MINLLKETIGCLVENGKHDCDVIWVGTREFKTDWSTFVKIANVDYDDVFGAGEVAQDLLIVGKDFWMERREYNGSEWWEFKQFPIMPKDEIELKAVTIGQADKLGFNVSCGWESLKKMNGLE